MNSTTINRPAAPARIRTAAYGALATIFQYPDRAALEALTDSGHWLPWSPQLEESSIGCGALIARIQERVHQFSGLREIQRAYAELFGHTVRGACPLYELEFGRGEIGYKASELADIAGFYSAFGMEITDEGNERADHLSVQCEFMSILTAREAYAAGCAKAEGREILAEAQHSFLRDHLGQWLPALAQKIKGKAPGGFYDAAGDFAAHFIKAECRAMDIECGPQWIELKPVDPLRDTSMDCDVTDACGDCSAATLTSTRHDKFIQGDSS